MFRARFVTCSRVPRPLDSLLSIVMRERETLKIYSNMYWETFNEIDGDFKHVAVRTFKVGLPTKHDLRKSLMMKPARSIHQLMDRIDDHKRVEEDQTQGKGKAKAFPKKMDHQWRSYNQNQSRRDFINQPSEASAQLSARCLRSQYIKSLRR